MFHDIRKVDFSHDQMMILLMSVHDLTRILIGFDHDNYHDATERSFVNPSSFAPSKHLKATLQGPLRAHPKVSKTFGLFKSLGPHGPQNDIYI